MLCEGQCQCYVKIKVMWRSMLCKDQGYVKIKVMWRSKLYEFNCEGQDHVLTSQRNVLYVLE